MGSSCVAMVMKMTHEVIHSCSSDRGGWNWCQLKLLGVSWPPHPGWLSKLIGAEVPNRTWELILRLRNCESKPERARVLDAYGLSIKTLSQQPDRGPMKI
jgi:hypothetical protein